MPTKHITHRFGTKRSHVIHPLQTLCRYSLWQHLFVLLLDCHLVVAPGCLHARLQNCEKRLVASSYSSVRPSAWSNSAVTEQILMNLIFNFFFNLWRNFKFN